MPKLLTVNHCDKDQDGGMLESYQGQSIHTGERGGEASHILFKILLYLTLPINSVLRWRCRTRFAQDKILFKICCLLYLVLLLKCSHIDTLKKYMYSYILNHSMMFLFVLIFLIVILHFLKWFVLLFVSLHLNLPSFLPQPIPQPLPQ